MPTKFILHGGFAGHLNARNDAFFKEILKSAPDNLKVLLVYFAKEVDRIPVNREEDIAQFERNKEHRNISFEVADESSFPEQIKAADVIYLHGGNTLKLIETLKKFPNLRESFEGKIVAGESAGAYVLSAFFYSRKADGVFQGLGFVPVKLRCHYDGKKIGEMPVNSMETILLPDYEFWVFNT